MTFVLLKLVALLGPLRVTERDEGLGLDIVSHGEEAYVTGEGALLLEPDEVWAQRWVTVEPEPAGAA
jgi:Amt family ammonium transporter